MTRLLPFLLLAPLALAVPAPQPSSTSTPSLPTPDPEPQTCTERVKDFLGWTLSSFTHALASSVTHPDDEPHVSSQVSFDVHNVALDYVVTCAASIEGLFDGSREYVCEDEEAEASGGLVVFRFDGESGEIGIRQRWMCYDDPEFPTRFTASGDGNVHLQCEESDPVEEIDSAGRATLTSVEDCTEGTVEVQLKEITAIAR